jgi:excisionase family DNA binding protein
MPNSAPVAHDDELPRLLTGTEVAALFRVDRSTVNRWREAGVLTAVIVGGTYRYREADIRALLKRDPEP